MPGRSRMCSRELGVLMLASVWLVAMGLKGNYLAYCPVMQEFVPSLTDTQRGAKNSGFPAVG